MRKGGFEVSNMSLEENLQMPGRNIFVYYFTLDQIRRIMIESVPKSKSPLSEWRSMNYD